MSLQDDINRLEQEKKAILEEYANPSNASDPAQVLKHIASLLQDALTNLTFLVNHAESESIRFQASKYVISTVLDENTANPDTALASLLKELKKNDSPKSKDDTGTTA